LKSKGRCDWAKSELMIEYHDREWGRPVHRDRDHFELLILEGAQAGLSWETVLKKREEYRRAFDNFDVKKVAAYKSSKIEELLKNPGIIRNRLKINSAVQNARAFISIQEEFRSFDNYIWQFTDNRPVQNRFRTFTQIPSSTPLSDQISRDLRRRGFNFVGTTICYAYMQAIGIVNDHLLDCFQYKEISALS
jgi:DNA-3-methyladenine glycosylase I